MHRSIIALLVLLLVCPGCGSGGKIAPVEGVVTLDGKPLSDVHVTFQPSNNDPEVAGMSSYALTDQSGKFVLSLVDSGKAGAAVGEHTVILADKLAEDEEDSDAGGMGKKSKSRIPPTALRTPIKITVKAGETNQADIALKSK